MRNAKCKGYNTSEYIQMLPRCAKLISEYLNAQITVCILDYYQSLSVFSDKFSIFSIFSIFSLTDGCFIIFKVFFNSLIGTFASNPLKMNAGCGNTCLYLVSPLFYVSRLNMGLPLKPLLILVLSRISV